MFGHRCRSQGWAPECLRDAIRLQLEADDEAMIGLVAAMSGDSEQVQDQLRKYRDLRGSY